MEIYLCSNGLECIEKANQVNPDVILLDTEITDYNCIEIIAKVRKISPQTRIIILTHSEDSEELFTAIKLGASGYITKDVGIKELCNAIELIYAGDVIMCPPLAEKMLQEFSYLEKMKPTMQKQQVQGLSKREGEVLRLLTSGSTNSEIGKSLFISENTVKVHVSAILEKLHVHNRHEAAMLAVREHMEFEK